jgi:hypothetical protein
MLQAQFWKAPSKRSTIYFSSCELVQAVNKINMLKKPKKKK